MNDKDFTKGKIIGPLMLFAMPVMFALFLQAMYGAIDLLIVGKYAAPEDVSAVSTGSQIMLTLGNLITSMAMGTTIYFGQQIGMGNAKQGGKIIGASIALFATLGCILSVLIPIFSVQISSVMQAPKDAFSQTVWYIRICGGGMLAIVFYNLIGAIFRSMGDSKTPLITVAIACVCNIAGDLILIAGFHLGAKGAAIAQNVGAGRMDRAYKALRSAIAGSFLFGLSMFLLSFSVAPCSQEFLRRL